MKPPVSSDFGGRQPGAVKNALTVLEEVALRGPGVTAQQLTRNLGLPRATTYRLLNLLVQQEYLVRMPDLTGFALGRKVGELANMAAPPRLSKAASTVLADLRLQISVAVHLVDFHIPDTVRILDADPRFPAPMWQHDVRKHAGTAIGHLVVADDDPLSAIGNDVRHRGYAMVADTALADEPHLAMPIHDDAGRLLAAIILTGSATDDAETVSILTAARNMLGALL